MPRYIMKIKDRYMEYSTITERLTTMLLKLEDLREILLKQYIKDFDKEFCECIKRIDEKGNSCFTKVSNEDILSYNRAGHMGKKLSIKEIIKKYWWDYDNEENNRNICD